ncbi:MAG: transposase [Candidatus Zixiibacteriota bacterium]
MIHLKNIHQLPLFDPWSFLGEKRRKLMDTSWAGLFRDQILPSLPVEKLFPYFDKSVGRPTKDLYTVIGVLLFQQAFDLTDMQTVEQLCFNIQWHYALDITSQDDKAVYMAERTLWSYRDLVVQHNLDKIIFDMITKKLVDVFGVDTSSQRLDSIHIKSNMRRLGRIRLFSETIHAFLGYLKKHDATRFASVDNSIVERYLSEDALGCFSRVKPSESRTTLDMLSSDLYQLVMQFEGVSEITQREEYRLLKRVLEEQCRVEDNTVTPKAAKEVDSNSLQNPSDPDATYSGHKGQGYQAQVLETFSEKKTEAVPNLITDIQVEPAHNHDVHALIPILEEAAKKNMKPELVLADSLYGSDDNTQKAAEMGTEIISPVMGGCSGGGVLDGFSISENGHIASCPQGHSPVKTKKRKERYGAAFDNQHCSVCSNKENCPVRAGKKYHYLHHTDKDIRISKRRAYEQSSEFRNRYRFRAGIEATMSEFDRRTGVKCLRVRGLKAVRYCVTLKAAALNIFRAAVAKAALIGPQSGYLCLHSYPNRIKQFVKELFWFFEHHICYGE